ncbi:hypothetical protein XENOCAPTIV_001995 [Xenoophorus captivus]|uniref:VLRF1 domain-containing protein n=1 Tax=Xenoophorus captivus TaxID=1517983 RepID=A0ABV0REY0_9TELE
MAGWPPATAEEFERKTTAGGETTVLRDLSSISGSESDSDEEDVDGNGRETGTTINGTDDESSAEPYLTGRLSSKVVFQNSAGEYLSVYRCMLMGKDLLVTWTEHLNGASAVFVRAPSYNKTIFFGGRGSPLQKNDPRIRSLPFATRRATFREVQRVHEVLSTVQVYGEEHKESSDEEGEEIQLEMVELTIGTLDLRESEIYPSRRRKKRKKKKVQAKVQIQEDEVPQQEQSVKTSKKPARKEELDGEYRYLYLLVIARFLQRCKALKLCSLNLLFSASLEADDESVDYGLRDALFTACKVGDVDVLCNLLQLPQEMVDHPEKMEGNSSRVPLSLLNEPIDSSGFTLLHVAAAAAQKAVVRLLLEAGADPACRNVFRKYMGEKPDKYDYSKAQVPGPLTAETESKMVEKKKAQRAQRKQREKEQKEENRKQELEAEEKKRRCWSCGESLLGKIPFNYLEYSFCTPRCVQAHRKQNAPPSKS